jgi:predicted AAA+ superfamily ATPase
MTAEIGLPAYEPRLVDFELRELLRSLPAVAIEGPRATGKTATGLQHARTVLRLDDPAQLDLVAADMQLALRAAPPILIDEWQRHPPIWDAVRRAVDADRSPARFVLTGSSTPVVSPAHPGAGRIVVVRMRPMSLLERAVETPTVSLASMLRGRRPSIEGSTSVGLAEYASEIARSGLPGVRHLRGRALRAQLDGYLAHIVEADIIEQGLSVRRPDTLRRWLAAYAAATATTATYETIRDAATSGEGDKPAKTTTQPWRDALERIFVADPLPAWIPAQNHIGRLARAPKHHLADPALAARLLGLDVERLLSGDSGPIRIAHDEVFVGQLFESLVTLCVRVYAQASEARVRHLRTAGGEREVDLIVERADGRVVAIEVKMGRSIDDRDVRHLHWLAAQLGPNLLDAVVVHSGPDAYRRKDGIAVVPAALLGP